jgi:hypothetical protein
MNIEQGISNVEVSTVFHSVFIIICSTFDIQMEC